MKELMYLVATATPTKHLVEKLQEALSEYELVPTEDNKRAVMLHLFMLLVHLENDGSLNKMTEMLKELNTIEKAKNLLTPQKN